MNATRVGDVRYVVTQAGGHTGLLLVLHTAPIAHGWPGDTSWSFFVDSKGRIESAFDNYGQTVVKASPGRDMM